MRFLFSTGSLYTYGLDRCFVFAAGAGFDGIELMVDERWDTRQPSYLLGLSDRYGLPIHAVHCPLRPVPGWPAGKPDRIEQTLHLAEELGASVLVHHLPERFGVGVLQVSGHRAFLPIPWWQPARDYRDWLADGAYQRLQQGTDVQLCIENMPAKRALGRRWNIHHWNSPEHMTKFRSLTMDTTHLGTWGLVPAKVYARWGSRVRHVHLSNFDGREHRLPMAGHLDLKRVLATLASDAYAGNVTIEVSPSALEAGRADEHIVHALATNLQQCRIWAGAT